jgi:aspartate carbamoyltransferase catalytic subunit
MNLLGLHDKSREEILDLLELASQFVDDRGRVTTPSKYSHALSGEVVALMFMEPSTRTRASFEIAAVRLGAHPLVLMVTGSSMEKGETLLDTCHNLEAMGVGAFVLRDSQRSLPFTIADNVSAAVINAGNGTGEHPTQALIDAFTLTRTLGRKDLDGVRVAIIGDVLHSRVARSNVYALSKLGADVVLGGPPQLLPMSTDGWAAQTVTTRREALDGADAVIMLRIQVERMVENVDFDRYVQDWGVDEQVMETEMKAQALIMHPGPVIRGIELSNGVVESPRSLILKQTGNGVAIRQAVLLQAFGRV